MGDENSPCDAAGLRPGPLHGGPPVAPPPGAGDGLGHRETGELPAAVLPPNPRWGAGRRGGAGGGAACGELLRRMGCPLALQSGFPLAGPFGRNFPLQPVPRRPGPAKGEHGGVPEAGKRGPSRRPEGSGAHCGAGYRRPDGGGGYQGGGGDHRRKRQRRGNRPPLLDGPGGRSPGPCL